MTGQEFVDLLALRLEDANKRSFPDFYKLGAVNNAQLQLANLLNNAYLTELEVLESAFTVTSGITAALTAANLTSNYSVLRSGQGVLRVKDAATGTYLTRIELKDIKRNENSYLEGTLQNPLYFVFANKIYTLPTTITSIDFWYLRQPLPIYKQYAASEGATTSIGSTDTDLSAVADFYNDAIIWNITKAQYYKVNDFAKVASTYTFTIDTALASAAAASDKFYILTHDHEVANLDDAVCELSEDLHEIVLDLAEADCWTVDDDMDRRAAALENAFSEIQALNSRVENPEGIGTEGNRRYAATTNPS